MVRKLLKGTFKFPKKVLKKSGKTTRSMFRPKKLPSIRNVLK